jgi:hypothetical protein
MSTSQAQADVDLDGVYGSGTPATVLWALTTTTPSLSANGGRGAIVEPTAAQYLSYARVSMTNNATNFPAASLGVKTVATQIQFPVSGGGASSPVLITHLVSLTADIGSGGRIIDIIPLPANTMVNSSIAPTFLANTVTITES